MKIKDIIKLAYDSLVLHKFRSLLSILGVTIGVAAIISGVILGVGNRESIMQKLADSGGDVLWFYSKQEAKGFPSMEELAYKPDVSITKEDLQYIKKQCRAVKEVVPYLLMPVILRYGGQYHSVKGLGFLSTEAARRLFRIKTLRGRYISELDVELKNKVCVIEKTKYADEVFGGEVPLGKHILIGEDKYKIIGTVKKMIFAFGYPRKLIALFPSTSLQQTIGNRKYTTVELQVEKIADVPKARLQLRQALMQRFGYPMKFDISGYSNIVEMAMDILNLMTFLIVGIAVISLTVSGVGIMNVMMAMVSEQTREIGIAKAIGAKSGAMLFLFLSQSIMLTLVGGILGTLLGLGASKLVTLAVGVPFIVPLWVIFLGFFLSFLVGIISGSFPAKRAAELDPAITLRQL